MYNSSSISQTRLEQILSNVLDKRATPVTKNEYEYLKNMLRINLDSKLSTEEAQDRVLSSHLIFTIGG